LPLVGGGATNGLTLPARVVRLDWHWLNTEIADGKRRRGASIAYD
jgi:hypothetical protein